MKILIIDSQQADQNKLIELLQTSNYAPNIKSILQAFDMATAVHLIHSQKPQLVFLDTDTRPYSGFKLYDFFKNPSFDIIISTNNQEHAIKAFKHKSTGYLSKPIELDSLNSILDSLNTRISKPDSLPKTASHLNKYKFPDATGWFYLCIQEINYIASKGKTTDIHLTDGQIHPCSWNLKECQENLENTPLIRVHRSFMVNLQHIKRYSKGIASLINMTNDIEIDVGSNYKNDMNTIVSYFSK